MSDNVKKLGLFALVGLVVGSSIGGGIFSATRNVAQTAAPGPALLAWLIVSAGMLFLVVSLNSVIAKKPELDGIVEYAEAGFGTFWGFISGWGYWLSAWLGNIAYAALLLSAAGNFIPALRLGGNAAGPLGLDPHNIMPVIVISLVMWGLTALVNRGIESAAFINALVLLGKCVPLAVVLVASIVVCNAGLFSAQFWTNIASNADGIVISASVFDQVKGCFMVMLWVFVGVEGASIFAARAKEKTEAARATTIGFLSLVGIYVLLSILPFGVMNQAELAALDEPALAFVLQRIAGDWGAAFVNAGLIVSLLGAWISWTLLPVETLLHMTKRRCLPARFGALNRNNVPTFSLALTTLCAQIFILTFLFPALKVEGMTVYDFGFTLCSSTILMTWLLGALYQVKLGFGAGGGAVNAGAALIGILAAAFQIWMILEAGLVYILLSLVTYLPGFVLYYKARKASGEAQPFKGSPGVWVTLIALLSAVSIVLLFLGKLDI